MPAAEAWIGGAARGTTRMAATDVRAGQHVMELRNPRYEPLQRQVKISPGETVTLRVNMISEGTLKK